MTPYELMARMSSIEFSEYAAEMELRDEERRKQEMAVKAESKLNARRARG